MFTFKFRLTFRHLLIALITIILLLVSPIIAVGAFLFLTLLLVSDRK